MAPPSGYSQHFNPRQTPQTEKAREDQVENTAGGYVFGLDRWQRLDRWLILGAEGGTYYATEQKLTRENAKTILECLKEDGARTVARIAEISDSGRAPKNDPAIFALALAASDPKEETRRAALNALPQVCRIGTHLFHFARDVKAFRGYSRMLRSAISSWYLSKAPDKLAYDLLKYQQRDGWGHRDLIRLSHPHPLAESFSGETVSRAAQQSACFRWAVGLQKGDREVRRGKAKDSPTKIYTDHDAYVLPAMLAAYDELKKSDVKTCIRLIYEHGFTHEMIPTEHKNSVEVWAALLEKMPMTAMVRNLGKMTQVGLLTAMGQHTRKVAEHLADRQAIRKARLHPISILLALKTYEQGHGEKGKLSWAPMREIVDALDEAFYLGFDVIEPTGKNTMLCLDISGSMHSGRITGSQSLTAAMGAAVMSMVTARTEKNWHIMGFGNHFQPLAISPKQRLDDILKYTAHMNFGSTDCSLPMLYAAQHKIEVDIFHVYTDNETYAGTMHPFQALKQYRRQMGRPAKLAVFGMTATGFTIADPSDAGMMDFVGLDSAAPQIVADFARN